MKNYKDYSTETGKGEIAFSIARKEIAVPTISPTEFPYNGTGQSPTVAHNGDETLYTTDNPAQSKAGDYNVTFTIGQPFNYYWTGEEEGEAVYRIG